MSDNPFLPQGKLFHGRDTLFYDGNCPICLKEINHLKSLAKSSLTFVDIHTMALGEEQRNKLLSQLHIKTSDGEMVTGFMANIQAWQHTKYRPILTIWSYPPLCWIGKIGYAIWLKYYQYQKSRCTVGPSSGG